MKKEHKEALIKVGKMFTIPADRGFSCFGEDSCDMCLRAAGYGQTTTPCEDDLESITARTRDNTVTTTFAMGIYTTPHEGEVNRRGLYYSKFDRDMKKVRAWRAWLRMPEGGIMGLPYPAPHRDRAVYLAYCAAECFNAEFIDIEDLGELEFKADELV